MSRRSADKLIGATGLEMLLTNGRRVIARSCVSQPTPTTRVSNHFRAPGARGPGPINQPYSAPSWNISSVPSQLHQSRRDQVPVGVVEQRLFIVVEVARLGGPRRVPVVERELTGLTVPRFQETHHPAVIDVSIGAAG